MERQGEGRRRTSEEIGDQRMGTEIEGKVERRTGGIKLNPIQRERERKSER